MLVVLLMATVLLQAETTKEVNKSSSGKMMKCGEGKCGSKMKTLKVTPKRMKCGEGKCGSKMKTLKVTPKRMKCGEGKCGNM